jgi:hypothetical protein
MLPDVKGVLLAAKHLNIHIEKIMLDYYQVYSHPFKYYDIKFEPLEKLFKVVSLECELDQEKKSYFMTETRLAFNLVTNLNNLLELKR